MNKSKDLRSYAGAAGIFILIVALLLFLSFNEIPPVNKDVFVSIVGMLVGSLSVVIFTIIGKNPEEVAELTKKNEALKSQNETLIKQKDALEKMVIDLQANILEKMTIVGASLFDSMITKRCECGKSSCNCKK